MIFVTILYIIICILLILLVLLQQGKGALGIIGGSSDTILGSSAGNVLTRITGVLATIFIVGAIVLSVLSSGSKSKMEAGAENVKNSTQNNQTEVPVEDVEIKSEDPFNDSLILDEEQKTDLNPQGN